MEAGKVTGQIAVLRVLDLTCAPSVVASFEDVTPMPPIDWQSFSDLNGRPPEVSFRLPTGGGKAVALDDFLQRQGLCLLFLPVGEELRWAGLLEVLAAAKVSLEERDVTPLAVLPAAQAVARALADQFGPSVRVLADEDGWVRSRYLSLAPAISADEGFVFLLDRWGAPLAVGPLDDRWVGEALDWFDLALARCPE